MHAVMSPLQEPAEETGVNEGVVVCAPWQWCDLVSSSNDIRERERIVDIIVISFRDKRDRISSRRFTKIVTILMLFLN